MSGEPKTGKSLNRSAAVSTSKGPAMENGDMTQMHDAAPTRVVDPSDAVTGLGLLFGAIGAVVGIVAAAILSPGFDFSVIAYCLVGALAGGSAGVVIGGMFGAIFAVVRGVSEN